MIEELIAQENYYDALTRLTDLSDEKTRYLRLVCLTGLKEYALAKEEARAAKDKANSTYYDVISIYITALSELQEYEDAIEILIEELSMPYIPYQYEVLFQAAYDQVLLQKQEARFEIESKNQIFSVQEIEQILKNKSTNEDLLYMAIEQLQQLNIRMIMPTIRSYLTDPNGHFFIKTMIMEILIEQQIDEELEVEKFKMVHSFNPSYMPLALEQTAYEGVNEYLSRNIEDENPSLYLQCVEFLEFVLLATYPKLAYEDEYAKIAASIHYYIAMLQGIDVELDELTLLYHIDVEEIEDGLLALKTLEC